MRVSNAFDSHAGKTIWGNAWVAVAARVGTTVGSLVGAGSSGIVVAIGATDASSVTVVTESVAALFQFATMKKRLSTMIAMATSAMRFCRNPASHGGKTIGFAGVDTGGVTTGGSVNGRAGGVAGGVWVGLAVCTGVWR